MDIKPHKLPVPASILMAAMGAGLALSVQVQAELPEASYASQMTRFYDDAKISANLNFGIATVIGPVLIWLVIARPKRPETWIIARFFLISILILAISMM